jgi:hypothetical protein
MYNLTCSEFMGLLRSAEKKLNKCRFPHPWHLQTADFGNFGPGRSGKEVNADFLFQKIGKSAPPVGCTSFLNPSLNDIPDSPLTINGQDFILDYSVN